MDTKQMAEIVGTTVKSMVDDQAQIQAEINTVFEAQLDAITRYLTELSEAVGRIAERVDNPPAVVMTEDQIAEQKAAYRVQVIGEAARLGVTGGELARAKKVVVES